MRALVSLLLPILFFTSISAQQSVNMTLLSKWDDNTLPVVGGVQYNDIWGYAVNGREFAILGSRTKVHFLEVTDPSNIVEVAAIEGGGSSTWRDMKTYGTYAYSVADQGGTSEGLLVFDLSDITDPGPDRVTLVDQQTDVFNRAHNVFVDVNQGFLYVTGPNSGDDLLIYNLNNTPESPTLVDRLTLPGEYVHDIYVEDNIAYCSHLDFGLYVYDMSPVTDPPSGANPGVPLELGVLNDYPFNVFNHSNWVSGGQMVFADEKHGSPLGIADVSDLTDITILDRFYSNLLNVADPYSNSVPRGPIPHNPFIVGDLCIASYYHDGVSVFDISNPNNVVQVGYYDTDLVSENYNGYKGCWGVYPFLPSGRILGSDVLNGLFVLEYSPALPVEWANFTAQKETERIRLDWSTTKEENNAGFIVQRSSTRNEWVNLAQVAPDEKQKYRAYDDAPSVGWNTYRIQQEDYDGKKSYSSLATVFWGDGTAEWEVYPNPVQQGSRLQLKNVSGYTGDWRLYDAEGKTLYQVYLEPQAGQASIALPKLPTGVYWLEHLASRSTLSVVIK